MVTIGIAGACGKMGKMIAGIALKDSEVKIGLALERADCPQAGKDLGEVLGSGVLDVAVSSDVKNVKDAGCIIDFTLPEPTLGHVKACVEAGVPMVIGTTGFTPEGEAAIKKASERIPIVFSPNMAAGVNILFKIVAEAAKALGPDFDIKVDETHHVHKKDSPSGTAKMIARVIRESSGKDVPIEAFREGEVIGNHGIVFEGKFETLEIRHDAKSREAFAAGAVKAAKFLAGKRPGLYSMFDVLGIE